MRTSTRSSSANWSLKTGYSHASSRETMMSIGPTSAGSFMYQQAIRPGRESRRFLAVSGSETSGHHQDDEDQEDQAEGSARVIAPSRAVGPCRQRADQEQDQDNEEDRSRAHPGLRGSVTALSKQPSAAAGHLLKLPVPHAHAIGIGWRKRADGEVDPTARRQYARNPFETLSNDGTRLIEGLRQDLHVSGGKCLRVAVDVPVDLLPAGLCGLE